MLKSNRLQRVSSVAAMHESKDQGQTARLTPAVAHPFQGNAGDPNDRRRARRLDARAMGRSQGIATAVAVRCVEDRCSWTRQRGQGGSLTSAFTYPRATRSSCSISMRRRRYSTRSKPISERPGSAETTSSSSRSLVGVPSCLVSLQEITSSTPRCFGVRFDRSATKGHRPFARDVERELVSLTNMTNDNRSI
jgi:hypothetical protein